MVTVTDQANNKGSKSIQFSELGERLNEPVIIGMLSRALKQKDMISLAAGFLDYEKLPLGFVDRAIKELSSQPGYPEFLQYGTTSGRPILREQIAKLLGEFPNEDPQKFDRKKVIVSTGSQQTLYISMQVLCNPGDIVLVEGPSYFVYLELLRGLGIKALSMPMKSDCQIDFERLDAWLGELKQKGDLDRIKATYIVSYFSNPSSRSMKLEEKVALAKTLKKWGLVVPVIEDAAYRDFYYDKPCAAPSVFSIKDYDEFPKLYLGTFTKPFATGLKVGYGICSDETLLNKLIYVKGHHDFGSSNTTQAIIEIALQKGWYKEWVATLHDHYKKKAQNFEKFAESEGLKGQGWEWDTPEGGLMVWLRGPKGFDTSIGSEFYEECMKNGVFYVPGDLCFAEGEPKNCVRLSVGMLHEDTLAEGVRRFAKSMRNVTA